LVAGVVDSQAEGNPSWPGGTTAGGSGSRVAHPPRESATAVAVAVVQYPVVDTEEKLDAASNEDDGEGGTVSWEAGNGGGRLGGRGDVVGPGDPRSGRGAAEGNACRRVAAADSRCGNGSAAGRRFRNGRVSKVD